MTQVAWNKGLTKETDKRVRQYSEKIVGFKHSKESKRKMKLNMKNNENAGMKNKHHTLETRDKQSLAWTDERKKNHNCIGRIENREEIEKRNKSRAKSKKWKLFVDKIKNEELDSERRNKISNTLTKKYESGEIISWHKGSKGLYHTSDETKRKQRISAIGYLKEKYKGKAICRIGKHETELLDQQEKIDNCKILRQYELENLGYKIDGYCPETNTVYEVYEKEHKYKKEKDLQRQQNIQNHLHCDFKIIWDK